MKYLYQILTGFQCGIMLLLWPVFFLHQMHEGGKFREANSSLWLIWNDLRKYGL